MITAARKNAAVMGLKPPQVAFVKALLTENLPIESNSVDCILSNPVANLLPPEGGASLLKEVHRILRPEGQVVLGEVGLFLIYMIYSQNTLVHKNVDHREKTDLRRDEE
jgi:predicted SAM-dependent methyltransferase